jgi:hypothetical protein
MRKKRLIGGIAPGGEENWNNLPVRKELTLKIRIEVHREMPNTFDYPDGRINESNAYLTENPRSDGVKRIKKQQQKSFSLFIAAPVVEMAEPESASHGPIEFLQFLRKNTRIGEIHVFAPIEDIRKINAAPKSIRRDISAR